MYTPSNGVCSTVLRTKEKTMAKLNASKTLRTNEKVADAKAGAGVSIEEEEEVTLNDYGEIVSISFSAGRPTKSIAETDSAASRLQGFVRGKDVREMGFPARVCTTNSSKFKSVTSSVNGDRDQANDSGMRVTLRLPVQVHELACLYDGQKFPDDMLVFDMRSPESTSTSSQIGTQSSGHIPCSRRLAPDASVADALAILHDQYGGSTSRRLIIVVYDHNTPSQENLIRMQDLIGRAVKALREFSNKSYLPVNACL